MKDVRKNQLIWYVCCIIIAAGLLLAGILLNIDFLCGFGTAFGCVVLVRTVMLLVRTKDEDARREYNASQQDERVVYIARRARSAAFYIMLLAEALGVVILSIMSHPAGMWLAYLVCAQALLYVICYYVIRAKS